jgi:hypothetical protein
LTLSDENLFEVTGPSGPNVHHNLFSARLKLRPGNDGNGGLTKFTVKYRTGPDEPWQWVKDQFGTADGSVLVSHWNKDRLASSWAESTFGDKFLHQWTIDSRSSQATGALLFNVQSNDYIPRNSVDDAKFEIKAFGSSHTGFHRYMALVRIWTPWLAPRQGEQRFHITEDAVMCSFLTLQGQHVVLLSVNGVRDTVTVFRSDADGHIVVAARNDGSNEGKFEFLAGVAGSFEVANAAVMYEAREIVLRERTSTEQTSLDSIHLQKDSTDSQRKIVAPDAVSISQQSDPQTQWLEEWYDGLTYCTWNSLGQDLTAAKIFTALDDLATHSIHVSGVIIDDNWQSLDGIAGQTSQFKRGWIEFEANREAFPDGLKSTVSTLKSRYSAIRDVAVWHGLHGYWGGLSTSGTIAKEYKTVEVEKRAGIAGGMMLTVDSNDIHRMYDDFYAFLASCGITSVKTDVQFYLDLLSSTPDRRSLMTAYQTAWTTSHLRHFSGKAISCMSQIPQILFHSFLPMDKPRILLRNSDDFFPDIPASHAWHVFCNAHNALLVQHLNVLPDWDMFQTLHPYAEFHAAARCISGGPIYITDAPGKHDLNVIGQMTAQNVRGQTVILRPSVVGKAIGIYDQYHDGHLLKVGTYNGRADSGNGILGVFNVTDHEISAMVPITDFPGIEAAHGVKGPSETSDAFVIRSHVTGQVSHPIRPMYPASPSNLTSVTLPIRGYDILTAYRVYDFTHSNKRSKDRPASLLTILGLMEKMTGACAIVSSDLDLSGPGRCQIRLSLKALGTLGIWMSDMRLRAIDDGFLVTMLGKVVPRQRVTKQLSSLEINGNPGEANCHSGVLEIDLLGAWNDLKLEPGWSNEVPVQILIKECNHD